MRTLRAWKVGEYKPVFIEGTYSEGAHNSLRRHFSTNEVVHCRGSLLLGSAPTVWIINNEEWHIQEER